MSFKKIMAGIALPLFLTSILSSQSLVELAKKEKERREKLKGQKKTVITNADLTNLKRGPALTTSRQAGAIEGSATAGTSSELSSQDSAEPSEAGSPARGEPQETPRDEFEKKWMNAREQVSLLTTKMNGLWQEYYSMDDMSSREKIQREISETSLKLQKAKEEEARTRKEFEEANRISAGKKRSR